MTSLIVNTSSPPLGRSPLDFLANLATEQQRTLTKKTNVTKADLAISPSLYVKALFMKNCDHVQLPLRPNPREFVVPEDTYNVDVSQAVRTCDLKKMRALHEEGTSFDACNRFGESLIHMACRRGDVRIVKFLIEEARVRVDVRDDFGRTICHDACWTSKPNVDVMNVLMQVVPPEFWVTEDLRGHTPFDYARRDHWGHWLKYVRAKQPTIVRKFRLV